MTMVGKRQDNDGWEELLPGGFVQWMPFADGDSLEGTVEGMHFSPANRSEGSYLVRTDAGIFFEHTGLLAGNVVQRCIIAGVGAGDRVRVTYRSGGKLSWVDVSVQRRRYLVDTAEGPEPEDRRH